jgi:hypothetical protein
MDSLGSLNPGFCRGFVETRKSKERNNMKNHDVLSLLGDPKVAKLETLPEGWRRNEKAMTAPRGWYWADNGKSRFKPGFEHALIKMPAQNHQQPKPERINK